MFWRNSHFLHLFLHSSSDFCEVFPHFYFSVDGASSLFSVHQRLQDSNNVPDKLWCCSVITFSTFSEFFHICVLCIYMVTHGGWWWSHSDGELLCRHGYWFQMWRRLLHPPQIGFRECSAFACVTCRLKNFMFY